MYGLTLVILCLAMFVAGLEGGHKGVIVHAVNTSATVWFHINLPVQLETATDKAKLKLP